MAADVLSVAVLHGAWYWLQSAQGTQALIAGFDAQTQRPNAVLRQCRKNRLVCVIAIQQCGLLRLQYFSGHQNQPAVAARAIPLTPGIINCGVG